MQQTCLPLPLIYKHSLTPFTTPSFSLSPLIMADPQGDGDGSSSCAPDNRRKGIARGVRSSTGTEEVALVGITQSTAPCGACKFLRRKCVSGCIFAPYFGSDQGAARFAAVHKVFGASNVSKLLLHIPVNRRHDAVTTISYEAQARLSDPVYGCISTIMALQHQVASLQAELTMVQTQLMNTRLAVTNALQNSQHQTQIGFLQPAYSNNSSASNDLVNISSFNYDFAAEATGPARHSFEHLQLSRTSHHDEDDEEESHNQVAFVNQIIH